MNRHAATTTLARTLLMLLSLAAALATGCAFDRRAQLKAVARDWCLTIGASQVIPVYPMTEDIQPGDVFLVQTPVQAQRDAYDDKGFLPLDMHFARLDPAGYVDFYDTSFFDGSGTSPRLIRAWLRPSNAAAWSAAPQAAFPTYSFSVKRGGGLNLAFPISGVPVGLALMGADAADGTVVIGRARTVGVDIASLDAQLRQWAQKDEIRAQIGAFAPENAGTQCFLRVVSRIYLAGSMDVYMSAASTAAAGAQGGVSSPLSLLQAQTTPRDGSVGATTIEQYGANLTKLNEILQSMPQNGSTDPMAIGGRIQVTAAAGRTISLRQEFDPPLTIGYLGYDVPIRTGGALGAAVATRIAITGNTSANTLFEAAGPKIARESINANVYRALAAMQNTDARAAARDLDTLARFIPSQFTIYERAGAARHTVIERLADDEDLGEAGSREYMDYRAYRGMLETSINTLENALSAPNFTLRRLDGPELQVGPDSPERERLQAALRDLRERRADPDEQTARMRAESAALDAYFILAR